MNDTCIYIAMEGNEGREDLEGLGSQWPFFSLWSSTSCGYFVKQSKES